MTVDPFAVYCHKQAVICKAAAVYGNHAYLLCKEGRIAVISTATGVSYIFYRQIFHDNLPFVFDNESATDISLPEIFV